MRPRPRGLLPVAVVLLLGGGEPVPLSGLVGPRSAMAQREPLAGGPFVGNRNSKVFHVPTCGVLGRTSPSSKIEIPNARVASINGFRPCGTCKPLSIADPGPLAEDKAAPGAVALAQDDRPEPASPEESPEDVEQRVRQAGLERWAGATSQEATVSASGRVMLFSRLPEARAEELLEQLNAQVNSVAQLLGPPARSLLGGPEKLSVFVFDDPVAYAEFARSIEGREGDASDAACADLAVDLPYLAAVDPEVPPAEPEAAEAGEPGPDRRNLAGLLAEQLAAEATRRSGNPPRWLSLGLGAYLAQRLEPRSPYYRQLRAQAVVLIREGGMTRTQELVGGQGDVASVRALGFGLLEWIGSAYRPTFAPFVRAMLADGTKFDDVIEQGYGVDREEFLNAWAAWALRSYARRR